MIPRGVVKLSTLLILQLAFLHEKHVCVHFSLKKVVFFLVACYATLQPALLVHPSVRWSVRHTLLFLVFAVFGLTAPAQMIK